ncbi:hypothetical protein MNV_980031 [Candidatus Methanoperedens nitroreducens]|uniref:Uncharacterized protein n=1 Tax=Candidatus Methanoperedens nitratireducens TaxID=1392998 RepID=A0A284VUP4_9EURY|nr:hypothetical protein MNV_980031 [Candidatus Methanoperedens nitroreducens]
MRIINMIVIIIMLIINITIVFSASRMNKPFETIETVRNRQNY